jgi:hypothetical protein
MRRPATWWRFGVLAPALAIVLGLGGCGDLPRPFMGNPGATARRLAVPPPPILQIPPPGNALLPDAVLKQFAVVLATALQQHEVPAVTDDTNKSAWRLVVTALLRGTTVVPVFSVVDPRGKDQGKTEGAPVPIEAWSEAKPATLAATAFGAAPNIADLLTHIEAALMQADPNSLFYRPAHVLVAPVTGAPGDGDYTLTAQMRAKLSTLGPVVQDTAEGADFTLNGTVRMVTIPGNQQRVEIQWSLHDAQGHDLGKVIQLNDIAAGSLDSFWGDVAVVVAQEAAGGVKAVIDRNSGHAAPAAKPASPSPAAATAPGSPAATAPAPQAATTPAPQAATTPAPQTRTVPGPQAGTGIATPSSGASLSVPPRP